MTGKIPFGDHFKRLMLHLVEYSVILVAHGVRELVTGWLATMMCSTKRMFW